MHNIIKSGQKVLLNEDFEPVYYDETIFPEQPIIQIEVDNPEIDEAKTFNALMISGLLQKELDSYNEVNSIIVSDVEDKIDPMIKTVLSSISEDKALIIGKLQQCLKETSQYEGVITQGEDEVIENVATNQGE